MFSKQSTAKSSIALFDRDRNGIFIHIDSLSDKPFSIGDRFTIHKGKRELFTLKIRKDAEGGILLDKNGIFINRNTRVDILLGGIYDEFLLDFPADAPETIIIRPR